MKVRTHISLGEKLKERAQKYAEDVEMDLSELVAHLLRTELANPSIGQKKEEFAGPAHIVEPSSSSTPRPHVIMLESQADVSSHFSNEPEKDLARVAEDEPERQPREHKTLKRKNL